MKIRALLPLAVALNLCAADPQWKHLSTEKGDLPLPWEAREQTAAVVFDFDRDGKNDFVVASRKVAPAVVAYRRTAKGWDRYVIEPEMLRVEAGGAVHDIDGDGDLDLVFGGDGSSNELWWWENPGKYDPNTGWTRRLIKKGIGNAHHDHAFADFKGTGRAQLAFWNQQVKRLFIADIPENPRETSPWPFVQLFDANQVQTTNKQEGMHVCDVDGDGRPDLLAGMWWFKHVKGNEFKPIQVSDRPGRIAGGKFKPGKYAQIVVAPGDLNGPIRFYECMGNPENPADWRGRDLLDDREMIHGHTLEVADINGDGHLDIFSAEMAQWGGGNTPNNPTATAWIWYGDGKGNFRRTVFQEGFGFHEARIADLDGDGRMDVLSKPYIWKTPRIDIWLQQPAAGGRKK